MNQFEKEERNRIENMCYRLWKEAWAKAGKSLFYMQFLYPNEDWGDQQRRIENMCYHLATEHQHRIEDTEENRQWFRNWLEKFDDEVENQC